ncbi:hypothetical protein [Paraburkholderia nemoris]|uniref:hypothetical protein n=1 Tax=Paraburkholderia nemoris TaxID=2793076 RepID=UPI0038B703A0
MRNFAIEPIHNALCFPVASFPISCETLDIVLAEVDQKFEHLERAGQMLLAAECSPKAASFLSGCVDFEPRFFGLRVCEREKNAVPYLIHTGYELPLFLSGKKKLGWLDLHPDLNAFEEFRLECFENFVRSGLLRKQERLVKDKRGIWGQIFYTSPDEEWRLQAYEMAKSASGRAGGWSEGFEEMLGLLMGYGEDENRWWRDDCVRREVFPSGMRFYCALDRNDLDFIRNSGYRALPWVARGKYRMHFGANPGVEFYEKLLAETEGSAGVVRLVASLPQLKSVAVEVACQVYEVETKSVPQLNQMTRGDLLIVYEK